MGAVYNGETAKRTLEAAPSYHNCVACLKGWLNERMMSKRVEYTEIMLARYPLKEHWKRVRFSDKVHFGFGPHGQLCIIRKSGVRYRQDCIQHRDKPVEKDGKRVHAWTAIGRNFKSDIHFYSVPSNTNGKITIHVYVNQILKPVISPWIQARGRIFI